MLSEVHTRATIKGGGAHESNNQRWCSRLVGPLLLVGEPKLILSDGLEILAVPQLLLDDQHELASRTLHELFAHDDFAHHSRGAVEPWQDAN